MCLNNIYELGSRLCELLSTLKKNREYVPLEILQTQYRIPYESLKKQIGDTATAFVKEITLSKLMINPDVSLEEQISVIQQAITTSGMLKEMSYTLSKLYDVELLHRQALKLRTYIEDALYPYIALQDCLVVDMERIEDTPIIYNTITQKVYENGQWSKQDLDLHGKLLIYPALDFEKYIFLCFYSIRKSDGQESHIFDAAHCPERSSCPVSPLPLH